MTKKFSILLFLLAVTFLMLFLLAANFLSGSWKNSKSKYSEPFIGMSHKNFMELCGSTDNVTAIETTVGGKIIYKYKKEQVTTVPSCYGEFTFFKEKLSLISK